MKLENLAQHYRIDKPHKFKLADHDPADCAGLSIDKSDAKILLEEGVKRLSDLQERLYADGRWSVLIVLQAMDAAGKDSVVEHVMTGVEPARRRRAFVQAADARRSSTTISSGAPPGCCRGAAGSASSTVPTTRKFWWCACTRSCLPTSGCRRT